MALLLPELQGLLLDMLSSDRPVDVAAVAGLQVLDWTGLLAMARQHRLLPMLHWRLTRERTDLPVPPKVSERLAAGFRRSNMRVLSMQRELLLIHRLLADAGIPCVALKGAYLAFHAYPHPALRPMRDLDILVPEAMAIKAYQTLVDHGFARSEMEFRGDLQANLQTRKHLPSLHAASSRISVEVHTRISEPEQRGGRPDLSEDPAFWQRMVSRTVAGDRLTYLSPTDLLMHLVEHAVYEHQFDNGPLTLTDLDYLLRGHAIDWPLFWRCAERDGTTRGALLLLKVTEHYFGDQGVAWPGSRRMDHESMDAIVSKASMLMFRDWKDRRSMLMERRVSDQPSIRKKIGVFCEKAFPPRKKMAVLYPVSEHSARIYLWYVAKWWKLLTVRLPAYLAGRREGRTTDEARHIVELEQWLQAPADEAGSVSPEKH